MEAVERSVWGVASEHHPFSPNSAMHWGVCSGASVFCFCFFKETYWKNASVDNESKLVRLHEPLTHTQPPALCDVCGIYIWYFFYLSSMSFGVKKKHEFRFVRP